MRLLTLQRPLLRAAARTVLRAAAAATTTTALGDGALASGRRYASVKAQGAYRKKSKRGIPNKLGAKRTGDQFVIPGNIIYKQRGTLWWPGENCIMGRDHTIHAMATGYVKYYRDAARHPGRKYIGVVFDKADTLPYPRHAERKRRLGMTAHAVRAAPAAPALSPSGIPVEVVRRQPGEPNRVLRLRPDYSYREDNWRIGRLVRTSGLRRHRFRTRKRWLRNRRWRRERELTGQRAAAARRERDAAEAEAAGEAPAPAAARRKKVAKKPGKAGKKKK